MPTQAIALVGGSYIPTTSLTGSEPATIYRGENVVVRGLGAYPRIESYMGTKDLGEDYSLTGETLTGTLAWTSGDTTFTGTGTSFLSELRPGQMILVGTEPVKINRIISDTSFIAERAPTTTDSGETAYYMPTLQELDKQRAVMRRGSAILIERKDILFNGAGLLYLNGTSTGFTATQRPKRLQRAANGTYSEFPWGFPDAPPTPVVDDTTGGWKGMLAGNYSFMFSYCNMKTGGFSNPCPMVKKTAGGVDLVIAASGRFSVDTSNWTAVRPTNADGILIWGSASGSNVATVNVSNFTNGPWLEVRRYPFAAKTITAVDTTDETLTIVDHGYQTGDYLNYVRTGGTTDIGGLTSGNSYFVLVIDKDTVKLASTVANLQSNTAIDLTGAGDGTNTLSYFDSSDIAYFEYLDAELGAVASGDNDPPPDCEFMTNFANTVSYLSCFGNRETADELGASPGSFAVFQKGSNPESSPYRWRVGVGDEITGFVNVAGRLFCLTPTAVPFITPAGRTELARLLPTPLDIPFTARPFWTKGGIAPHNITGVQGDVYLFSGRQPLRSPSTADEKSVPFELGKLVRDITKDWADGYVFVVHDPKNQQVTFISSATKKNEAGYWISEILPLDLTTNPSTWQPKIILTSSDRDMIVCGAAVVNNRLEILAGGRQTVGDPTVGTFRYDERAGVGESKQYFVVWQPTDNNEERRAKYIEAIRVTARSTQLVVSVHGATWNDPDFDISQLEEAAGSNIASFVVPSSAGAITRYPEKRVKIKNLLLYAVKIVGTWVDDGSNEPDRIDELVISVGGHGGKY